MEQQIVQTISISGSEVKVSPMAIPEKLEIDINQKQPSSIVGKFDELKAFEASFYPVENPDIKKILHQIGGISKMKYLSETDGKVELKDGYYPAPEGLTFTVKWKVRHSESKEWENYYDSSHEGLGFYKYKKQVAVVTFSEPKEAEKDDRRLAAGKISLREQALQDCGIEAKEMPEPIDKDRLISSTENI